MDIHKLYAVIGRRFRTKRMLGFVERFGVTNDTRILDVGGSAGTWMLVDVQPDVTILNLDKGDVLGDGLRLPFRDNAFDIVFSNSVIEHLFSWANQRTFASEVRRVGKRYFVQTPNRYFPIEPHYLTPFVQFLPPRIRIKVLPYSVRGLLERPPREEWALRVSRTRLLDRAEMDFLFDSVRSERFMGLSKALVSESNLRQPPRLHLEHRMASGRPRAQ